MKETQQDTVKPFPRGLEPQDRLFLEMAVVDRDLEEAGRLIEEYGLEVREGTSPVGLCREWLKSLRDAERHNCQNVIDLRSQGKSMGGM